MSTAVFLQQPIALTIKIRNFAFPLETFQCFTQTHFAPLSNQPTFPKINKQSTQWNPLPLHNVRSPLNSNKMFFFFWFFIVVFKNELFRCRCKTINFNFLYVALKHSPSKRKSLSRVAQRSTEADSDSHRKYNFPISYSFLFILTITQT